MERTERLFDILGQIDPALIAAVDLNPIPQKKPAIRKWISTAACLCLCTLLGLTAWRVIPHLARGGDLEDQISATIESIYPDAKEIVVPGYHLEIEAAAGTAHKRTTGYLYDNFTVGERYYHVGNSGMSISSKLIGEALGTADAAYMAPSIESTEPMTYYRVRGIDDALAVAVIFDGEEDIYLFANQKYRPATLGELITAAYLTEYLTLGEVTVQCAVGEEVHTTTYQADTALTTEYLLRPLWDVAPVRVHNGSAALYPATDPILLNVKGRLGMFGYTGWQARLSYNGYLIVPLFGNSYIFPVSEAIRDDYLSALAEQTESETVTEPMPMRKGGSGTLTGPLCSAEIYDQLTVDGDLYECRTVYWGIEADRVGEELGQVKAGAAQTAPTATYYRLRGIDPEAGIAVRFPDCETYYSYFNLDFAPATLGELIEALDLHTNLRAGAPTLGYREATVTQTAAFSEADVALLLRHVFANTNAPAVQTNKIPRGLRLVEADVQIPLFSGTYDYSLYVGENGWLYVYLMNIPFVFDIGFERDQVALYAKDLILRDPNIKLSIEDAVKCPVDKTEWSIAPDQVRYSGLEWAGITYATAHETVDPATVLEVIEDAVAVGVDPVTRMLHHKDVTLYALSGYSPRHAVGVRFGETEEYCLYINRNYTAQMLGDFMAEHSLRQKGTLCDFRATVYGEDTSGSTIQRTGFFSDPLDVLFPAVDPMRAWDLLMGDPNAPHIALENYWDFTSNYHHTLYFTLRCEGIGDGEIDVILSKEGYLCFELKEYKTCQLYEIGQERAQAFLDYIMTDCLSTCSLRGGFVRVTADKTWLDTVTEQVNDRFRISQ